MHKYKMEIMIEVDKKIKRLPTVNEIKYFIEKLLYIHPKNMVEIKLQEISNELSNDVNQFNINK